MMKLRPVQKGTLVAGVLAIFSSALSAQSNSLEFRGLTKVPGGDFKFRISNKDTNYQKWLKLGQRSGDYKLTKYEQQEKTHTLF